MTSNKWWSSGRGFKCFESLSDDVCMGFRLNKCAKVTFKQGKPISSVNIILNVDTVSKALDQEITCKYLSVNKLNEI